jgi:hypothetical protein
MNKITNLKGLTKIFTEKIEMETVNGLFLTVGGEIIPTVTTILEQLENIGWVECKETENSFEKMYIWTKKGNIHVKEFLANPAAFEMMLHAMTEFKEGCLNIYCQGHQ